LSEAPVKRSSLGGSAAKGGVIFGVAGVIDNVAQFLRAILLARILAPVDFGIIGMAWVVLRAGEALSQTGFHRALVQKRGDAAPYLDTVWVVSFVRGFALFGIVWAIAPVAGVFFATPDVVAVIRTTALVFPLLGWVNPALFMLERELAFARIAVPRLAAIVVDLVASVGFALAWRNVWAMVWGYLLGKAVYVAASYAVRPHLPRFRVRIDQVVEFYRYGRHIFRATLVDYMGSQVDRALVGRLLGAGPLGFYSFGRRLATLPATAFLEAVVRVAFPVFARAQADAAKLRTGFLRATGLIAVVAAPVSAGLWAVSSDMVRVVFGPRWIGMIPCFEVLCAAGLGLALCYLVGTVLSATGRPDLAARGTYVLLAVELLPLFPATRAAGVVGAAWCVTAASMVTCAYFFHLATRHFACRPGRVLRVLAPSILAALAMAAVVAAIRGWVGGPPTWFLLAGEVVVGALLYMILMLALDRIMDAGVVQSLKSALGSATGRS
jgi:O-antigen/teichoic acid export membrane protein